MFKLYEPRYSFCIKPQKAKIFERQNRGSSSARTCQKTLKIDLNFNISKSFREKLEVTQQMLEAEKNELQITKRELHSYRSTLGER